jgi:gamma-glutamyltranspeptidase
MMTAEYEEVASVKLYGGNNRTVAYSFERIYSAKIGLNLKRYFKSYLSIFNQCTHYTSGGIVSEEDLKSYQTSFKPPLKVVLSNGNYTLYNPPPPSSGAVMSFITSILDGKLFIIYF